MRIFGRDPALWLTCIGTLLGLGVAFNIEGLSAEQSAAVQALIVAAATAVQALLVRPVAPTVFAGVVTAGAVLLAAYGLDVGQERLGAVQLAVAAVVGLLVRAQSTPNADPAPATHTV
jgi:hypothetical protein